MLRPVPGPDPFVASVEAAAEVQDRAAERRRREARSRPAKPKAQAPQLPAVPRATAAKNAQAHYGLSDHEFQVYGALRMKHGMSQADAAAAVLRSRRSAPVSAEALDMVLRARRDGPPER